MKVVGIIAEYNPFHNGHLYHLQQAKALTGADYVVVVLSGDFTQRGLPAIVNRRHRSQMALHLGADLVCSLPIYTSTASAPQYALGAICLLNSLGVITDLVFGIDKDTFVPLQHLANYIHSIALYQGNPLPQNLKNNLDSALKMGYSYPTALSKALLEETGISYPSTPNATLALQYLIALQTCGSSIRPFSIPRIANAYHDKHLSSLGISSATAIRNILTTENISQIKHHIPRHTFDILGHTPLTLEKDFDSLYQYRLGTISMDELVETFDMPIPLAHRIYKHRFDYQHFHQFIHLIKNKSLTYTTISRGMSHLLLHLTKSYGKLHKESLDSQWIHILGFKESATPLLHQIKKKKRAPMITNTKDIHTLPCHLMPLIQADFMASQIYHVHQPEYNEYRQSPIILKN